MNRAAPTPAAMRQRSGIAFGVAALNCAGDLDHVAPVAIERFRVERDHVVDFPGRCHRSADRQPLGFEVFDFGATVSAGTPLTMELTRRARRSKPASSH